VRPNRDDGPDALKVRAALEASDFPFIWGSR
jgi:hypothetical protein